MAAADPQAFFLTPPPRHLAELRIDTAPSAVSFSAPCGAARGKRRCLVPAASVRKRMLLELAPFDIAPAPSSSTPPPPPMPSPSPTASSAGPPPPPSPTREFSFHTAPRVMLPPVSPGNIFAFMGNSAGTPGGSEARSGLSFSAPLGQQQASGAWTFLAPTATGPTANGGFVFAAPPPETPTSTTTSGGPSFLASPSPRQQPLTPMGSTATGGFAASSMPSLIPPLKPARNDFLAFPSPGLQIGSAAPSAPAKEPTPLAGLAALPPRNPGNKMPSLFLRRAATRERRESLREQEEQQQFTPPPPSQKATETNASDALSFTLSASSASPCSTFFTSPSKEAAKQEAKKVLSEASQSPAGSRCSSSARSATPEKENKQGREVEVSSSPRESAHDSPRECSSTSPAVFCPGAEVVVRVTCKCGVHKEFCFDHRL